MTDAFRFFLECINLFFIIYLIGYSSFLFLSVVAGAIELYKSYRLEQLHNKLWQSYYIPVSILVPAYNEEVTVKDTCRQKRTVIFQGLHPCYYIPGQPIFDHMTFFYDNTIGRADTSTNGYYIFVLQNLANDFLQRIIL